MRRPLDCTVADSGLGDVWALSELWNTLGLSALRRVFSKTRHRIDVEALLRIMAFNRLCDPDSKLGVLCWLETVAAAGVHLPTVTHQHLLRSMDALMDHQGAVAAVLAGLLRPMIDQELAVVFYNSRPRSAPKAQARPPAMYVSSAWPRKA